MVNSSICFYFSSMFDLLPMAGVAPAHNLMVPNCKELNDCSGHGRCEIEYTHWKAGLGTAPPTEEKIEVASYQLFFTSTHSSLSTCVVATRVTYFRIAQSLLASGHISDFKIHMTAAVLSHWMHPTLVHITPTPQSFPLEGKPPQRTTGWSNASRH